MGLASITLALTPWAFTASEGASQAQEEPAYTVAPEPWPAQYGNHRAVVEVDHEADAILASLPWRRQDRDPSAKRILVIHADSDSPLTDVAPVSLSREMGHVVFRPAAGPGRYCIYYLPFTPQAMWGGFTEDYLPPEYGADPQWVVRHRLDEPEGGWRDLPQARLVGFEARSEFNRLDPMKLIMTEAERADLLARHPQAYLVFPEPRERSIWMLKDPPRDWRDGPAPGVLGEALRGEFYPFQLGVYAARADLRNVRVSFTDLVGPRGERLPAGSFACINTGGTDWTGDPLTKRVSIPQGEVRALWCGLMVPESAAVGEYHGTATVRARDQEPTSVAITLDVRPEAVDEHGDNDLWRFSRLRWLNSTIAQDNEVVEPYSPMQVSERDIDVLGRRVSLGAGGLPENIVCGDTALLAQPVYLEPVIGGEPVGVTPGDVDVTYQAEGAVEWGSGGAAPGLSVRCDGRMEFDGHVTYHVTLTATEAVALDDVRLNIPLRPEVATYLMGIGHDGGRRPSEWNWHWDAEAYFDSFWVGDVKAGLQLELRGASYTGPMVNLYSSLGQLAPPASWYNGGAGGVRVFEEPDAVMAQAFTGPKTMAEGEELELEFALLITPVKPLDSASHFQTRYYHSESPVDEVLAAGGNVVNIHHGGETNPFINYPFLAAGEMAEYVRQAHEHDIKVKIYYTLREMTNHVHEMPALLMLDHEVIAPGAGGGYPWLREHLVEDYTTAWYQPLEPDPCAAIVNTGESRWYNYYLEGLNWLAREVEIDGLYLDDVSFDRRIIKRVRKILKGQRPGSMIDLHSNTMFSRQPANQYMEFFPYIDRLWFGEGFNYERGPDYWLTEISGIPFGLMGEMLQDGGNAWRGMVYGMTTRAPWSGNPGALWRAWDEFGMGEAEILGYWDERCPVSTGRDDIKATAYVREGAAMISVATWNSDPQVCDLAVDWGALGIDPDRATIYAPAIDDFQPEALFEVGESIPIPPRQGWLLVVSEQPRVAPRVAQGHEIEPTAWAPLFEESFDTGLGPEWEVRLTDHPGTTLTVEDGAASIHSQGSRCAFLERALPPEASMVVARLNPGDDSGQTWGIGLGVGSGESFLRVNLRAVEGRAGVDGGLMQMLDPAPVAPGQETWLRIRLTEDWIFFEASSDGDVWVPVRTMQRHWLTGRPDRLAVGKMSPTGTVMDVETDTPMGNSQILEVHAYRATP